MHPHPPHYKASSLKEHILHFFMLFLAILGGAFAENYREHHLERTKEKDYFKSLILDLNEDIENIDNTIKLKNIKVSQSEQLIDLLSGPMLDSNSKDIYYFSRLLTQRDNFHGAEGTIDQLQYSGGFRLIESDSVVNGINKYIGIKSKVYKLIDSENDILMNFRIAASKIFIAKTFSSMLNPKKNKNYIYFVKPPDTNPLFFSKSAENINSLVFWVSSENGNLSVSITQLEQLKVQALELKMLIEKEI